MNHINKTNRKDSRTYNTNFNCYSNLNHMPLMQIQHFFILGFLLISYGILFQISAPLHNILFEDLTVELLIR